MKRASFRLVGFLALTLSVAAGAYAQQSATAPSPAPAPQSANDTGTAAAVLPPGYVIGPEDLLSIVFWRDKDLSAEVVVRPDGKISLPLLNDVVAAGYTPEGLRDLLVKAAQKYVEEPNATVVVKEIRSRKVYITGAVPKPSTYPLNGQMTVLQLISLAGGVLDYADTKKILIIRNENGGTQYLKFNYNDVVKQKNVQQNIALKPGDTVVVP